MNPEHIIYFAYGANLDKRAMRLRCPGCQPLTRAVLTDYRLVFRGPADIEDSPGDAVHGAVYKITPAGLESLDRFEHYPHFYTRKIVAVVSPGGKTYSAVVYQMVKQSTYTPPFEGYLNTIITNCRNWGISEEYIRTVIRSSAAAHFGEY